MASVSCSSLSCNEPARRQMSHSVDHSGEGEMVALWLCPDCAGELERRTRVERAPFLGRLRRGRGLARS